MSKNFDLTKFDKYKEDNRREVKKANGGLPKSLWESYSSFANTDGGVIILGVEENEDGTWATTGLKHPEKLIKEFWDLVNNEDMVSLNLLKDSDVAIHNVDGDTIIVIEVPRANRQDRPVYIKNDMFKYTYKRNFEGDYRCTKAQVLAMLRDQTEDTSDMKIVDWMPLSDLNQDTVQGYRNMHQNASDKHPFSRLTDEEYLRSIGAAGVSKEDGELHPTTAGLLMFGNDFDIVREFPEYFLDYQEKLDPSIRWTDRLWSTSGTWSGNVFDFFLRVYSKIAIGLKVPFKQEGIMRVDDTPIHKAVREALVNCLSNADYFGVRGVVIRKTPTELILENPGYIRTGKIQMKKGGVSDPRNKTILKMFNLLDIGERSGSGVPNIFNVWSDEGWAEPLLEEEDNPDRTRLTLVFGKQAKKTSEENKRSKTEENEERIKAYLKKNGECKTSEIAEMLSLSESRARAIISSMDEVEAIGNTTNRRYKMKNM